jgi:hypothetical protein
VANIPEAVSSRTMKIDVNQSKRALFDLQSMSDLSSRAKNNRDRVAAKNIFVDRWRCRQAMVNMVEKMIYVGILEDVDMSVCHVVMDTCIAHLKACGAMMETGDTVRGTGFIKLFARSLTILHAVDKFARGSSVGQGRPYAFANLLPIAPFLVGTEEIAMFTMTILSDQLISANKLNLVALILAQCAPREGGLMPNDSNEIECHCCEFRDVRYMFNALHVTQKGSTFRSKMSLENLRATFVVVNTESYNGRPVLVHDEAAQIVRLNMAYVQHYFEGPTGGNYDTNYRPRSKYMPYEHILEAYNTSYAHRHSCNDKRFVLGCIPDLDFPFVLNTFDTKRNEGRIMTLHDKGADMDSGEDAYRAVNKSFELSAISARVAMTAEQADAVLYGYPGYCDPGSDNVYPDTLMDQFASVHRIDGTRQPNKYRRIS